MVKYMSSSSHTNQNDFSSQKLFSNFLHLTLSI